MPKWPISTSKATHSIQNGITQSRLAHPKPQHDAFISGCCLSTRSAAWYQKREPSFSDAIAAVRRLFWSAPILSMSRHDPDGVEIPAALWERLTEALCYEA